MSSVLLRTIKYALCSLSSLPSCSSSYPIQLCTRQISFANYFLGKKKIRVRSVDPVIVKKPKSDKKIVDFYSDMTVSEIANSIGEPVDDILETLVEVFPKMIDTISPSMILEREQAVKIASAFDCKPRFITRSTGMENHVYDIEPLLPPAENELLKRPPVVAIMGHVDHGKTTLLDCLRHSHIVDTEFGGITQHIGAFTLNDGKNTITFLDTPGHAAFAQMRERGAQSTDIVVLVVAADDGVKEQTVQSIKYAKDAGVPIVVAINKCDKPNANPDAAKRSLLPYDVIVEDFHGDVLSADISALYGKNIDVLRDAILLQAEEMNLRSTPKGPVEGIVIESTTVHGIGKLCTMIVQRGTLKKGNFLVCGTSWAKVRLMTDETNREVKVAGPSIPVRVAGWKDTLPSPGERVNEVSDERQATSIVAYRERKKMEEKANSDWTIIESKRAKERQQYLTNRQKLLNLGMRQGSTLRHVVHKEVPYEKESPDEEPSLKLMIFSDVDGTLEAILNVLNTYSSKKVKLQLLVADVGTPSAADIELAAELGAVIYCFNVTLTDRLKNVAGKFDVKVENFNIIYRLVEDLKNRLSERLPPEMEMKIVGEGRVIKEFVLSDKGRKKRTIAGVLVQWGKMSRHCTFRYFRNGKIYYEDQAESLQCENQDVTSVQTGREVGIAMINRSVRYKEDDVVVALEEVSVKKVIDWEPPGF